MLTQRNVKVFEANDTTVQSTVDKIFSELGGSKPSCNGQFSDKRYALLFKSGYHNVSVNIGYYTHVMGLGNTPSDTEIRNVKVENGDTSFTTGALVNFWRSAENFKIKP